MKRSRVIALLTDFGTRDPYVGAVKGVLLSRAPGVTLVDLTHEVPPGRTSSASFLLASCIDLFPKGCVFLCVVDPGVGSRRKALALECGGHFFVGPDNGLFPAALTGRRIERAVDIGKGRFRLPRVSSTFHGRDLFAPVAAALAKGVPLARTGKTVRRLVPGAVPTPLRAGNAWEGEVVWVDTFGNLVTNVPASAFSAPCRVRVGGRTVGRLGTHYAQVKKGRFLALAGSFGTVEISANGDSAAKRLKVRIGAPVELTLPRGIRNDQ